MYRTVLLPICIVAFWSGTSIGQEVKLLSVHPAKIQLAGKDARQRVVVMGEVDGRNVELTAQAKVTAADPSLVKISEDWVITPLANGKTTLNVQVQGQKQPVPVTVTGADSFSEVTFERDVQPIMARFGCNSGGCHGKARGQNGFQLSLLGFDHDFDYAAIIQEARGRRVFPANPEYSLLLRKGSGQMPHGGGRKLPTDHPSYQTLLRWIAKGAPRTPESAPKLERISIFPEQQLLEFEGNQQVVVTAHYSDGSTEDVTHMATYQSSESVYVDCNDEGLIKAGPLPGEAAIMARYMEKFAICHVLVPLPSQVDDKVYEQLPRNNFIDGHVWNKLQQLNITPSGQAEDHTLHRRIYLDLIGRVPTPEETRAYLADKSPNKREKLIDSLLERPEYADFWANKWADLLRPNPYRVGIKAVFNLDGWLREVFRENKPYDEFVRELVTASGSTFRNGAVVVFRDRRDPDEITTMISQLFLGVRLDCAKCHHHPFEIWSQDDFYSFAAYFGQIGRKGRGVSPPISGDEEFIYTSPTPVRGGVKHPLTDQVMSPKPLLGETEQLEADDDPRVKLAAWMTSPENPYFSKVIVNRVWAELMGRGIVDPVDDLRATNPPSNGPLLDALADDFKANGYDLKKLIKTITMSYVYGLSSVPNERNAGDGRNYSRHYRDRLRAEILLDAVSDMTGVPESFSAMPPGSRSMELWTVRSQSLFLDSFGRPDPNQDPPCERTSETTVVQALHLMNAPGLHQKVTSDQSRASKWAASKMTSAEIVEEAYLWAYSRFPDSDELETCVRWLEKSETKRRQQVEDLLWALINTPEFVFKD